MIFWEIWNGRVMPIESWGKSGVLAYFWLKIGYSGHIFWDMDFKFVLPIIYINIKGKTQFKMGQLPTFVASDMCLDFLWQWFFCYRWTD